MCDKVQSGAEEPRGNGKNVDLFFLAMPIAVSLLPYFSKRRDTFYLDHCHVLVWKEFSYRGFFSCS